MNSAEIAKLRRDEKLTALEHGTEAVPIAVQFQGPMPPLPRPERKQWLLQHFAKVSKKLERLPVRFDIGTLSVSGQTMEAVCGIDQLNEVRHIVESAGHRVALVKSVQATLPATNAAQD